MMQAAELAVLDWLQAHLRCDFLDAVMPWISRICDHGEIWILLAAVLLGCKQYVSTTAGSLRAQVQSAYAQTLTQQYPQAQQAFRQAAHSARQASKKLGLLVRRNALDRMNETMAVLPQYANPENQADLAVEAARVLAQIDQLEQCFTGTF